MHEYRVKVVMYYRERVRRKQVRIVMGFIYSIVTGMFFNLSSEKVGRKPQVVNEMNKRRKMAPKVNRKVFPQKITPVIVPDMTTAFLFNNDGDSDSESELSDDDSCVCFVRSCGSDREIVCECSGWLSKVGEGGLNQEVDVPLREFSSNSKTSQACDFD